MRKLTAEARAIAVRAYITGLRLESGCLPQWVPYLDEIADHGRLSARSLTRFVYWVCAREELYARHRQAADRGYRDPWDGLHKFLRVHGFLSEFGRARRSWVHVEKMVRLMNRRRIRKRVFHQGRTVWTDFRCGLRDGPEAMSRGWGGYREDSGETLRDYVQQLIADWKDGLCGHGPKRKLPDWKEPGVRWNRERRMDCYEERREALKRRRHTHG